MNFIKIELCRRHWQSLAPDAKDGATAKHLLAAVGIAERLLREKNKLEMENRKLRTQRDSDRQRLDWLEEDRSSLCEGEDGRRYHEWRVEAPSNFRGTVRDAIDDARSNK